MLFRSRGSSAVFWGYCTGLTIHHGKAWHPSCGSWICRASCVSRTSITRDTLAVWSVWSAQSSTSAIESGKGLPQSKTLRVFGSNGERASVLDCASPLALWLGYRRVRPGRGSPKPGRQLSVPEELHASADFLTRFSSCRAEPVRNQPRHRIPNRPSPGASCQDTDQCHPAIPHTQNQD